MYDEIVYSLACYSVKHFVSVYNFLSDEKYFFQLYMVALCIQCCVLLLSVKLNKQTNITV